MAALKGSLWGLFLYDVAEEIRLDEARQILGAVGPARVPGFRRAAPEYVRFARPPIVRDRTTVEVDSGDRWSCVIKFYEYGVVSVALELSWEQDWAGLVQLSSHWIGSAQIERKAAELARAEVEAVRRT